MSNDALITEMPNASVATDGSFVEMELKNGSLVKKLKNDYQGSI